MLQQQQKKQPRQTHVTQLLTVPLTNMNTPCPTLPSQICPLNYTNACLGGFSNINPYLCLAVAITSYRAVDV